MKLDFRFDEFENQDDPLPYEPRPAPGDEQLKFVLDRIRELMFGRAQLHRMKGGREFNRISKWLRSLEEQLIDHLSWQWGRFSVVWPDQRIAVRIETKTFIRNGRYDGTLRLAIYS